MSIETELPVCAEQARVLVCGARDYTNFKRIYDALDKIQSRLDKPMVLIEGEARGADSWGRVWAEDNLPEENLLKFPAEWKKYGRAAGPRRNQQMLEQGKPNLVLAFGGLQGRGTNDMVRRAKNAGITVVEFDR
jgi:hypothetical protein